MAEGGKGNSVEQGPVGRDKLPLHGLSCRSGLGLDGHSLFSINVIPLKAPSVPFTH